MTVTIGTNYVYALYSNISIAKAVAVTTNYNTILLTVELIIVNIIGNISKSQDYNFCTTAG